MSSQRVMIMGNIAHNLELKVTEEGSHYVKFGLMVSDSSSGPDKLDLPILAFRQQAEKLSKLKAGSPVFISGRSRPADNKPGYEIVVSEFRIFGGKNEI